MDFAAPHWLWLTLAGPGIALAAAFFWRRRLKATAAWAARGLWDRLLVGHRPYRLRISVALVALAALCAGLALARPRWGESEQHVERRGVDVVFLLDTSLSMATRDVAPNRLWVAQTLVRRLVEGLGGNRLALVQAEGDGVVMVPLTLDGAAIELVLDAVQPGSLPTPGTELAPAFNRALKVFPEEGDKHRVVILLSDGEDHGAALAKVTDQLRSSGVVVHAIGVGTVEGKPLELPPEKPGAQLAYKRDETGQVVVSRLVETTLEELARSTGGVYVRATSAAADLGTVVDRIGAMERRSFGSELISSLEERFQWPLGLAVMALGLHLAVAPFRAQAREAA